MYVMLRCLLDWSPAHGSSCKYQSGRMRPYSLAIASKRNFLVPVPLLLCRIRSLFGYLFVSKTPSQPSQPAAICFVYGISLTGKTRRVSGHNVSRRIGPPIRYQGTASILGWLSSGFTSDITRIVGLRALRDQASRIGGSISALQ